LRLGREVALKILPEAFAADPGRSRRFEREARAASALNHPNIVTVYEVGSADALPYIAMELVEGKTLRSLLAAGSLPRKRILDLSSQIADGLARAHDAGIVHRDLKPENVMVSADGLVKILDFGLAKRLPFEGEAGSAETLTQEGSLVGTVGYMSPEQASGRTVDYSSDQFSFGSILYEMATGRRPFQRRSAVETLAAVINDDPEPVEAANPGTPGSVRWIVKRCLAKDPLARYASTRDLAQELKVARDDLSTEASASPGRRVIRVRPRRLLFFATLAAAIGAALSVIFLTGSRDGRPPTPDFQRLTFGRGAVWSARFAPDGRTVVYAAAWEGDPIRLFSTRTDGRDSTRLDLGDADVESVSTRGEIAMLLGRPLFPVNHWAGTLARAPIVGGAARETTENVVAADWAPDGNDLAIVRKVGEEQRLEYRGRILFETPGWIESMRFSPSGDRIAFLLRGLDVSVETVDLAGKHDVLSRGWKRARALAWSPDGREIWFSANERGWRTPIYAVDLRGKQRLVLRLPTWIDLQDVARDGRTLVSLVALRTTMRGLSAGEPAERDLSWHESSLAKAMTPDGKTLLFDEGSEGDFHAIYVRPMDGSPAKRIGEGRSIAISPDGRWVAANAAGRGSAFVLMPTGAGETKVPDARGHHFEEGAFFPDGRRILLQAVDPGRGNGSFVMDLGTGTLQAIGPEGASCLAVSPDGREAACEFRNGEGAICPVAGGPSRPIPGLRAGKERPVLWSADGRSLFVGPQERPGAPPAANAAFQVFRIDLATGNRELWHEFAPPDRAGLMVAGYNFAMTPDGRSYAYSYLNAPSDLYLVTGLK
ncbi:MAG TPA: WD40 repeat domain-containing serine/threonine protein kinase, partial [Thermoanaerobaculia bacterium]|nr:WD40 repeat domain-containing serine/threonine protein kinase [Thermoanaerobaculia bacterium]